MTKIEQEQLKRLDKIMNLIHKEVNILDERVRVLEDIQVGKQSREGVSDKQL